MKIKHTTILIAIISIITGCSSLDRQFSTAPLLPKDQYKKLAAKYADRDAIIASVTVGSPSDDEKKTRRNNALSDEILLSDYYYNHFKIKLFARDAGFNSVVDLTSIGLSGAATLVGGGTGQILSGADTALKAAQGKISDRWLASKTIPVLISKMDSDRAAVLEQLGTGMGKPYAQFSTQEGLKLIEDYNSKGNLINALNSLQAQTSATQTTNEVNAAKAMKESLK